MPLTPAFFDNQVREDYKSGQIADETEDRTRPAIEAGGDHAEPSQYQNQGQDELDIMVGIR
jgi:hypothetical protein